MTNHFTFFASYYDSIEHLDNDLKAEFLDVLLKYALRDELPEKMTPVVQALFTFVKREIDSEKSRTPRLPWSEWRYVRAKIFERDGHSCIYCGDKAEILECDHILPVSRGGSNKECNLVTSCCLCNRAKGSKTVDQWLGDKYE